MNLTTKQYEIAFIRFPGLEAYLNKCSLMNEFKYLNDNELILNEHQKTRLSELRGYKESGFGDF